MKRVVLKSFDTSIWNDLYSKIEANFLDESILDPLLCFDLALLDITSITYLFFKKERFKW